MIPLIYGLALFTTQAWLALSIPVQYDQRQHGDVNVQIDVKDVKIIALLKSDIFDDYVNYDYAYDDADFTIKPVVKPTKPPKTTTAITSGTSTETSGTLLPSSSHLENNTTENSLLSTNAITVVNNTKIFENSTPSIDGDVDEISLIKLKNEDKPENQFEGTKESPIATTEVLAENPVVVHKQKKRCRAGYDKSGRCHRRRISLLPLAMKVAPEFLRSVRQQLVH